MPPFELKLTASVPVNTSVFWSHTHSRSLIVTYAQCALHVKEKYTWEEAIFHHNRSSCTNYWCKFIQTNSTHQILFRIAFLHNSAVVQRVKRSGMSDGIRGWAVRQGLNIFFFQFRYFSCREVSFLHIFNLCDDCYLVPPRLSLSHICCGVL